MADLAKLMQGVDLTIQAMPRTRAMVSESTFMGIMWTFIGLTLAFVVARLGIRLKISGKLSWDDALVILAFLFLLSTAIIWKIFMPLEFRHYATVRGEYPFDMVAVHNFSRLMKVIAPANILFYSGLWAVKLSFLLFFRQLGKQIRSFELWWWVVVTVTGISYIGCIADIQWECTTTVHPVEFIFRNCATFPRISWVNRTLYANCGLDIGTDLMILSIPVLVLWNTRVPLRKKIVLFTVFAATVAIMVVSVVRVVTVNSETRPTEIVWLYFWSFVENGTAIIIACVASFRQLFVSTHSEPTTPGSRHTLPSFVRHLPGLKTNSSASSRLVIKQPKVKSEEGSIEEQIAPLEFVSSYTNDLETR